LLTRYIFLVNLDKRSDSTDGSPAKNKQLRKAVLTDSANLIVTFYRPNVR
jgi:hypothetical protein